MNIKENIISLYLLRILNQVIPLLSMPYLVRVLGADSFGGLVFVTAIMGYLLLVADYGFNLTATRDISKSIGDTPSISKIYGAVLSAKTLILCIQLLVLCLVLSLFSLENSLLYICCFFFMLTQTLFPAFFFQGVGEMRWITILSVSSKLISVIVIILTVDSPSDLLLIPLINAAFGSVATVAAFFLIRKKYFIRIALPSIPELKIQFKSGWNVFSSNIYSGLYAGSGVVILGLVSNNTVVASYSLAEKLLQAMKGGYLPLIQALFPWFSRFISSSKQTINIELVKKMFYCLFLLAIVTIFASFGTDHIVILLFGKEYLLVGDIFMILLFIPVVDFLRNISGVLILINLGREKLNRLITQVGALLGIALIYILSLQYGAKGAAIGLVLTEVCIAFSITYCVFKIIRVER